MGTDVAHIQMVLGGRTFLYESRWNRRNSWVRGVEMAEIAFTATAVALAALTGANVALLLAKLLHKDRAAKAIVQTASSFVWLLRLGDDSRPPSHHQDANRRAECL
jgi:hypothetical protein